MIKIGLLGLGTVGSGVYEIINERAEYIKEIIGKEVEISKILVRDINKKRNLDISKALLTTNPYDILENPEIDIVVEVMGGVDTAYKYITTAFNNGKHVVTSNKEVVSKYLYELSSLAEEKNKAFLFEASVAGGIPIIKPLKQNIKINDIDKIQGILNGTTNFILTKMYEENLDFNEALKIAQELGYAEADPTSDVEGLDSARKLSILSSIAFRSKIDMNDIVCRGISSISALDIKIFKELGLVVKLLAKSIVKENQFSASVEPVLIDTNSILSNVKDAYNIVLINGHIIGELQFYGQGAGKNPTGNAVVCDIIDVLTGDFNSDIQLQNTTLQPAYNRLFSGKYYVRIVPENKNKIPEIINAISKNDLKYDIIREKDELIFITESTYEDNIKKLINIPQINDNNCCYIRID